MFDTLVDLDALMPIVGFGRLNLATLEDVKLKRRSGLLVCLSVCSRVCVSVCLLLSVRLIECLLVFS